MRFDWTREHGHKGATFSAKGSLVQEGSEKPGEYTTKIVGGVDFVVVVSWDDETAAWGAFATLNGVHIFSAEYQDEEAAKDEAASAVCRGIKLRERSA